MTSEQATVCVGCGAPLTNDANFCSSCGVSRSNSPNPHIAANQTQRQLGMKGVSYPSRRTIAVVAVGLLLIAAYWLGLIDAFVQGLKDGLGLTPNLSIEITKGRDQGPAAKFGYIRITNLGDHALTIKNVAINHRKDAACSFGAEAAILGGKTLLEPGDNIIFGTAGSLLGLCGSILIVSVSTDKGSADYNIDWR